MVMGKNYKDKENPRNYENTLQEPRVYDLQHRPPGVFTVVGDPSGYVPNKAHLNFVKGVADAVILGGARRIAMEEDGQKPDNSSGLEKKME